MARRVSWSLIVLATLGGCQALEAPPQQAARRDEQLAQRLSTHLGTLPGIATISVAITSDEPAATWLPSSAPACATRAAAVMTLTDAAQTAAITDAVRAQLASLLPSACPPAITVLPNSRAPADRPAALSSVGPFRVAAASKRPLQLTLAALLIALGALLIRARRAVAA